jgi:hypothetical protein
MSVRPALPEMGRAGVEFIRINSIFVPRRIIIGKPKRKGVTTTMEVRIVDERGEIAAVVKVKYTKDNEVANELILRLIEAGLSVGDKIEVLRDGLFVAVVDAETES